MSGLGCWIDRSSSSVLVRLPVSRVALKGRPKGSPQRILGRLQLVLAPDAHVLSDADNPATSRISPLFPPYA